MSNATLEAPLPKATRTQRRFVNDIRNPQDVLLTIERGHSRISAANGDADLIAVAKFDTENELAELEGADTAMIIIEQVWPAPQPIAKAA